MHENESKHYWLRKGEDVIHVQASGYQTDQGFCQIDATCDLHDRNFKFLGTLYALLGPVESEVRELESLGWRRVERNKGIA
jgi:hypothetical protein